MFFSTSDQEIMSSHPSMTDISGELRSGFAVHIHIPKQKKPVKFVDPTTFFSHFYDRRHRDPNADSGQRVMRRIVFIPKQRSKLGNQENPNSSCRENPKQSKFKNQIRAKAQRHDPEE